MKYVCDAAGTAGQSGKGWIRNGKLDLKGKSTCSVCLNLNVNFSLSLSKRRLPLRKRCTMHLSVYVFSLVTHFSQLYITAKN